MIKNKIENFSENIPIISEERGFGKLIHIVAESNFSKGFNGRFNFEINSFIVMF